jgi:hypothetical protein
MQAMTKSEFFWQSYQSIVHSTEILHPLIMLKSPRNLSSSSCHLFHIPKIQPVSSHHNSRSPLSTTTPESRTKRRIMMGQIQHILRQARSLNNTPHLDRTLILNQRTDGV